MQKETVGGSTMDVSEIVIDYRNQKTEIKDVPPDKLPNRLSTAFIEWGMHKVIWEMFIIFVI